jgi:hypothetical protein
MKNIVTETMVSVDPELFANSGTDPSFENHCTLIGMAI